MSEQGGAQGGPHFEWDVAVDIGDMSGGQQVPEDDEGMEIVRQFGALKQHPREAIYNICGNHDRSGLDEPPAWWWRKWVDPTGEHSEYSRVDPAKRPYPIEGTWERYAFQVGNIQFLLMSDVNEPSQKLGRGQSRGSSFRRGVRLVEGSGGGPSRRHRHFRPSLHAERYDCSLRRMGRRGQIGRRKLDQRLPRLQTIGYAKRCFLPVLGGQQTGRSGVRRLPGSPCRLSRPMVRRPHPYQSGRHLWKQIPHRNKMGHPLHKRRRHLPSPWFTEYLYEPPSDIHPRIERSPNSVLYAYG